jgi:hypothetical protein
MRSDDERKLRELYDRSSSGQAAPAPDPELEAKLLARQKTLYPPKKGWTMNFDPRLHPGRLALAAAFLLLLGLGACSMPSSYDVEVGQAMAIQFSKELSGPSPEIEAVLADLDGLPGVEGINVNERIGPDGVRLDIRLVGRNIDADLVVAELQARHPVMADAEISMVPVEQTVEGPLYEKLGHDLFGMEFTIEVCGDTPEEMEQYILDQLAADGFEGEADVEVIMDEETGQVEILMELGEDCESGPDCNE